MKTVFKISVFSIFVFLLVVFAISSATKKNRGMEKDITPRTRITTFEVKKGRLDVIISAEGKVSCSKIENISLPNISGDILDELKIGKLGVKKVLREGSWVEKDDVIIELDNSAFVKLLGELERDLESKKLDLEMFKKEMEVLEEKSEQDLKIAQNNIETKRLDFEKFKELEKPKSVLDWEIKLEEAGCKLREAEKDVKESKILLEKDMLAKEEYERYRLELEKAKKDYKFAKLDYEFNTKIVYPSRMVQLENEYKSSKLSVERTAILNATKKKQLQNDMDKTTLEIKNLEDKIKKLKGEIEKLIVKAPVSGKLFYGAHLEDRWEVRSSIEEIEEIVEKNSVGRYFLKRGKPVMHVPDMSNIEVEVFISPNEVSQLEEETPNTAGVGEIKVPANIPIPVGAVKTVSVGAVKTVSVGAVKKLVENAPEPPKKEKLKAEVGFAAFPLESFTGEVKYVSKTPEKKEPWQSRGDKFKVIIAVDKLPESIFKKLELGAKAQVKIFAKSKETIFVPVDAVFEKTGKNICYVVDAKGGYEEREVELGISNRDYVEIKSGLKEKDVVYIINPTKVTK